MLFGDYLPERWIWASMNDYYHVYAVIELTLISVLRSTYICMPHNDVTTRDLFASLSNSWAVTSFVFCASFARSSVSTLEFTRLPVASVQYPTSLLSYGPSRVEHSPRQSRQFRQDG